MCGFVGETRVLASVDVFGDLSKGGVTFVLSVVKSNCVGLFFVLKRLKGSDSSDSLRSSGLKSHLDATVAPTCLEAGWSFPHTVVGDVSTLHLCKKAHSVLVQPFLLKKEQ